MNDIKYPKTELFVVLGTKVYPLYTTEDPEFVHNLLTNVEGRERLLSFEVPLKSTIVAVYGIQAVMKNQFGLNGQFKNVLSNHF